ncbi:MAG: hypothetical protein AAFP69_16600, partial [Planctomycetota bacterium]
MLLSLKTLLFLVGFTATYLMPTACLWDTDTLAMERSKFPTLNELIVGHFPRHSQAYYEWRIKDRSITQAKRRHPEDFDDLAVAQDKLGRHAEAIETMREKLRQWPDTGLYKTHANLGTFLVHSGQYEEGLKHIQKAIEINPDAHFGREIYQQRLVEYMMEVTASDRQPFFKENDFRKFVLRRAKEVGQIDDQSPNRTKQEREEIERAVKGVSGMIRFGNHDSPILLAALAQLLDDSYDQASPKRLAARAYLRSAENGQVKGWRERMLRSAANALKLQQDVPLQLVRKRLEDEVKLADKLQQRIAADERRWIESGTNVDRKFAEKY